MDSFIKADVFFFITSIAVTLFTIVGVVIAFYLIKIARSVSAIAERTEQQVDKISNDIDTVREGVKKEGIKALKQFAFFKSWFGGTKKNRK